MLSDAERTGSCGAAGSNGCASSTSRAARSASVCGRLPIDVAVPGGNSRARSVTWSRPRAPALRDAGGPVQIVASVGLWSGWVVGLVATVAPHPIGLTALRLLVPAAVVAAVATGRPLAVAWTAVTAVWTFAPPTGAWCVNGP